MSVEGKYLVCDGATLHWAPIAVVPDPDKRADERNEIAEAKAEHAAAMKIAHAETMRGAKVGLWLLVALTVVVVYAAAQIAGFVP